MHIEQVLIKPLLTEKTSLATEVANKYAFIVQSKANKNQIKEAVEKLFDVKVIGVSTSVRPGKMKRAGKFAKKTSSTKRALVQVKEGQKLDLFKGI